MLERAKPSKQDIVLRKRVEQKIRDCVQKLMLRRIMNLDVLFVMPEIRYTVKGVVAGFAFCHSNMINFNWQLLKNNADEFIEQTVPHELAHILVFELFAGKRKPHGMEWRGIMRGMGAIPKRTHNYEVAKCYTILRNFVYACKCQEYNFTIIRHRRAEKGTKYSCRKCHTVLEFVKKKTLK